MMGHALITGAASGIGLALTHIYLQQNHTVMMVDKNQETLLQKQEILQAQYPQQVMSYVCDITQEHEVQQLEKHLTQQQIELQWIYNNAGIIGTLAPIWSLSAAQIHQVMDVNVYGMLHMIRHFVPRLLQQQQRAHIINMASLYGLSSGSQLSSYAMSKHAVLALSESLYFDLDALGHPIDVSIVFPSFTDTGLLSQNSTTDSAFHHTLSHLLAHSREALDTAAYIVQAVAQKHFYILPDHEVNAYCEERTKAILNQNKPHKNSIEQLIGALLARQLRSV